MSRTFRWLEFILGIILGFSLALLITWWVAPNTRVLSSPAALHPSFRDEYHLLVASAYRATGDVERARSRLLPLHENDVVKSLLDQAIRYQSGQDVSSLFPQAGMQAVQDLALLAQDLQSTPTPSTPTLPFAIPSTVILPTRTWLPFDLISHEPVCDSSASISLAHIYIGDSSGQPLTGVQVIVTWEGGQEKFSTGLKPEKGLGYADFILTPGVSYTIQIQPAYQAFTGISSPTCDSDDGSTYPGGLVLIFQQP
jgi:hypothetical protein